jgi:hypothetical protein
MSVWFNKKAKQLSPFCYLTNYQYPGPESLPTMPSAGLFIVRKVNRQAGLCVSVGMG